MYIQLFISVEEPQSFPSTAPLASIDNADRKGPSVVKVSSLIANKHTNLKSWWKEKPNATERKTK